MDSHLVINERGHGEQVEDAAAVAPGVAVPVFVLTLVIEAVHLRDLPRLVVPSQQGYPWDTENSNQSYNYLKFGTIVMSLVLRSQSR